MENTCLQRLCNRHIAVNCRKRFTDKDRQAVHQEYWKTGSYEKQRQFIVNMVKTSEPKVSKRSGATSPRSVVRKFFLPLKGDVIPVCKDFFMNTLNIKKRTNQCALSKKLFSLTCVGHIIQVTLSTAQLQAIKTHIESYPKMDGHYVREQSKRQYLGAELNMYLRN